jgi:hypothetical protein
VVARIPGRRSLTQASRGAVIATTARRLAAEALATGSPHARSLGMTHGNALDAHIRGSWNEDVAAWQRVAVHQQPRDAAVAIPATATGSGPLAEGTAAAARGSALRRRRPTTEGDGRPRTLERRTRTFVRVALAPATRSWSALPDLGSQVSLLAYPWAVLATEGSPAGTESQHGAIFRRPRALLKYLLVVYLLS